MLRRLKRITEEISTMSTSLPASWDSCIFVAVDDERMDVLRWERRGGRGAVLARGDGMRRGGLYLEAVGNMVKVDRGRGC